PDGLLAAAVGECSAGIGAADRLSAAGRRELPWAPLPHNHWAAIDRTVEETEPPARSDVVYDVARGLQSAALSLQSSGANVHRDADRDPESRPDRGADRVFRQHAGHTRRSEGQSDGQAVAGANQADGAGRLCASGPAVRAVGGGTRAGAKPEPVAG